MKYQVGDLVKMSYLRDKPTEWATEAYKKGSVFLILDEGEPMGLEEHKCFYGAMLIEKNKYVVLRSETLEKVS